MKHTQFFLDEDGNVNWVDTEARDEREQARSHRLIGLPYSDKGAVVNAREGWDRPVPRIDVGLSQDERDRAALG